MPQAAAYNLVTLLALLAAGSASCSTAYTTRPGRFDPTVVTKLHRDASTAKDVRQLLGTPSGQAAVRLPGQTLPSNSWFYEKVDIEIPAEAAPSTSFVFRQTVLFVFFKNDRYDGYWWFSNAPEIVVKKVP